MPIYGVALVFILFFNWVSDFRKERANWITVVSIIAAIGFIITVAVDNKKVKYAFLCFGESDSKEESSIYSPFCYFKALAVFTPEVHSQ